MIESVTIDELRQAVINDYAQQCAADGGTQANGIPLESYKALVAIMTWNQLISETSVIANAPGFALSNYVEHWLRATLISELTYDINADGSTTLSIE